MIVQIGYISGRTVKFSAYDANNDLRGAALQELAEIGATGVFRVEPSTHFETGDFVAVYDTTGTDFIVGYGEYKPKIDGENITVGTPGLPEEPSDILNVYDERIK